MKNASSGWGLTAIGSWVAATASYVIGTAITVPLYARCKGLLEQEQTAHAQTKRELDRVSGLLKDAQNSVDEFERLVKLKEEEHRRGAEEIRRLEGLLQECRSEKELDEVELKILTALKGFNDMTIDELREATGEEADTVSHGLARLDRRKLVKKVQVLGDPWRAVITIKGRDLLKDRGDVR